MAKARVLSSKTVFRGPLFSVTSEQIREPAGYTARRDIVRHRGSVVVMAVGGKSNRGQSFFEEENRAAPRGGFLGVPPGENVGGGGARGPPPRPGVGENR